MENIFKLSYQDKDQAVTDLVAKGILIETEDGQIYGNGVQAVVEIGLIVLDVVEEQPVCADGYHYDVMSTETYDFGANLVEPKNPKHAFAGHAVTEELGDNVIIDLV
jgi:hypothetical protein